MKLFGFDTDESVDQIISGSSDLPDTAKGSKQKPLPPGIGYGWKPSDEQTQKDIVQADIRDKIIREATRQQQPEISQAQPIPESKPFTATSTAAEDRKAIISQAKQLVNKLGTMTRDEIASILENYDQLKKELVWTPLPAGEDIWAEGQKNGKAIKEDIKKKAVEMSTDVLSTTPTGAVAGMIERVLPKLAGKEKIPESWMGEKIASDLGDITITRSAKFPDKVQVTYWSGKAGISPTVSDEIFDSVEEAKAAVK